MLALYHSLDQDKPYRPEAGEIADRTLKNICLGYLSALDEADLLKLVENQYDNATNMTDRRAALGCVIDAARQDKNIGEACTSGFL